MDHMSKISEKADFVAVIDCTYIEAGTAFLEDLVTLHRRTLQQIF